MLILLPPSEGKTAPARGRALRLDDLSSPALTPARADVLDALVGLCRTAVEEGTPDRAAAVLGLGRTQLDAVHRDAALETAPTARADRVYTGVLYEALGLPSLSPGARRRATSRVATASALFGLVRPHDRIPAYRLSGDVTLPGLGGVASFWGRHLADEATALAGDGLVVDLRSSTYQPFWRPGPEVARRTVTVRVLHEVDGRRSVVSHFNKATKGRIVRALLEDGGAPRTPERFAVQLKDLGWDVEVGPPGRGGTRLDVVVTQV